VPLPHRLCWLMVYTKPLARILDRRPLFDVACWLGEHIDVADQPVNKRRQRAHRHTPAATDVDRGSHHWPSARDGRPSTDSCGGSSGVTRQQVIGDAGLVMRTSARTVTVLARQRSPRNGLGQGFISNSRGVRSRSTFRGSRLEEVSLREGDDPLRPTRRVSAAAPSRDVESPDAILHLRPLHTPLDEITVWPQPGKAGCVIEMQLQRGGALEVPWRAAELRRQGRGGASARWWRGTWSFAVTPSQ